jgi:hypothetical protein
MTNKEFACARKILGRTQKQMAELLGTSKKTVSSYEQGWRSVPVYVERQIYFFISRIKGINGRLKACWDVKKCSEEVKHKCPAWEFNVGKLCWFISGTFCAKCLQDSPKEKLEMCRNCDAFSPISRLMATYMEDVEQEKKGT